MVTEQMGKLLWCRDRWQETVSFTKQNRLGRWKHMRGRIRRKEQAPPKAPDRLAVLEVIAQLEREGKFDVDAEEDPPTIPLLPDMVDYLKVRPDSIIKRNTAYLIANKFVDRVIREKKLVIKKVYGMEYLNQLETGAIITCNHFNPFDCFTVERIFQRSKQYRKKRLFKVIREGNYTNFPGFYGYLFRNCDTLPLSGNKKTMYNFLMAVDTILQRGDFILIYPEQSLWWNYRKPKPLKNGAFKFAEKNQVPVLPVFICMEDSTRIGNDGFPIQEYTIFIKEPIYPKAGLTEREKAADMRDRNYEVWKKKYEEFYGIPLEYTTNKPAEGQGIF